MISEERLENDKISFQMCEGIGSMYIKEYEKFSLHIVLVFCFFWWVLLHADRIDDVTVPEKKWNSIC